MHGGRGQRPFGVSPKLRPFSRIQASLKLMRSKSLIKEGEFSSKEQFPAIGLASRCAIAIQRVEIQGGGRSGSCLELERVNVRVRRRLTINTITTTINTITTITTTINTITTITTTTTTTNTIITLITIVITTYTIAVCGGTASRKEKFGQLLWSVKF